MQLSKSHDSVRGIGHYMFLVYHFHQFNVNKLKINDMDWPIFEHVLMCYVPLLGVNLPTNITYKVKKNYIALLVSTSSLPTHGYKNKADAFYVPLPFYYKFFFESLKTKQKMLGDAPNM